MGVEDNIKAGAVLDGEGHPDAGPSNVSRVTAVIAARFSVNLRQVNFRS
jgi:hypothetical protein